MLKFLSIIKAPLESVNILEGYYSSDKYEKSNTYSLPEIEGYDID